MLTLRRRCHEVAGRDLLPATGAEKRWAKQTRSEPERLWTGGGVCAVTECVEAPSSGLPRCRNEVLESHTPGKALIMDQKVIPPPPPTRRCSSPIRELSETRQSSVFCLVQTPHRSGWVSVNHRFFCLLCVQQHRPDPAAQERVSAGQAGRGGAAVRGGGATSPSA